MFIIMVYFIALCCGLTPLDFTAFFMTTSLPPGQPYVKQPGRNKMFGSIKSNEFECWERKWPNKPVYTLFGVFHTSTRRCIVTFDLDLYIQGNSVMTLKKKSCSNMAKFLVSTLEQLQFRMDSFHTLYLAQTVTSVIKYVAWNWFWPWFISSRLFHHEFAIKLLKYGTSFWICCTALTFLNGFCTCLSQKYGWVCHV